MTGGPETTDVVILCGGRGTRLGALTGETPKPLLPVGGRPFLLHVLARLKEERWTRVILAVHHLAGQFQALVPAARELGVRIELVEEPEPLGTGGGLRHAARRVRSSTLVAMNGDSWISQPLAPVLAEHEQAQRDCTIVAVQASQVEGGARRKGIWRVGPGGAVLGFATEDEARDGWVNGGVYLLSRELVLSWPTGRYSLEDHLATLLSGRRARVFRSTGRLLDIGTPECYAWANRMTADSESLTAALSA